MPLLYLPLGAALLWMLGQIAVFGPAAALRRCPRPSPRGGREMRASLLVLLLALPLPVLAGSSSAQTLEWRQDDARLALRSTEGVVRVDAASPEARFGVRHGDRILRVDDSPVRQIEQLADAVRVASTPTVHLLLRRDGRMLTVPVASGPVAPGHARRFQPLQLHPPRRAWPALPSLRPMPAILIIDDNAAWVPRWMCCSPCMTSTPCRHRAGEGLALLESQPVDLVIQDMNFSEEPPRRGRRGAVRTDPRTPPRSAGDPADRLDPPEQRGGPGQGRCRRLPCQAVARSELPVLITGPNGAGKEKIAQIIQANSLVAKGPFVAVNCGALPLRTDRGRTVRCRGRRLYRRQQSARRQVRGSRRRHAVPRRDRQPVAGGQMKLLRVLETGRFERLGSNRERQVKVRVVSATNADLPAMIREGTFREDLYYRLNTVELTLPPLADRPGDIVPLAEHFLNIGKPLSSTAATATAAPPVAGNVRELRNVIQRAETAGHRQPHRSGRSQPAACTGCVAPRRQARQ
ncbi:sigma-54 interaction domain-containing protein [Ditylenchus destructor]|uniref:Sigma-54 interaction domain-containing protein n=1 Tax=Ditylenchus destructor TaxID=166010 RepID=A0AAD4ME07_9BILA|nr:sigma-54 interaction domain-containing protein [Ditylenchus destructor]